MLGRVRNIVAAGLSALFLFLLRGAAGQLLTEWTNSSPNASVRDYVYAGSRLIAVVPATHPTK